MKFWLLLLFSGFLGFLEILSYKYSLIASYMIYLWSFGLILVFVISIKKVILSLFQDFLKSNFSGFISLFIIVAITFVGFFPLIPVNHESTQEIAAAIQLWSKTDMGYSQNAFLGYPNRQYLVASLPSFFLISPFSLNLGFVIPYMAGLLLFYVGLKEITIFKRNPWLLACFIISFSLFPYLTEFIWHYEQVMLPISFFLQSLGLLILYVKKQKIRYFLGFVWSTAMLTTCYTPGLSAWFFMLGLLVISFFLRHTSSLIRPYLLAAFIFLFLTGIGSLVNRADLRTGVTFTAFSLNNIYQSLIVYIKTLLILFAFHSKPFIIPPFSFALSFFLILSLFNFFSWPYFLSAVWFFLVVTASIFFPGYASPPYDFAIHRAIITIPVILLGFYYLTGVYLDKYKLKYKKILLLILFTVLTLLGLLNTEQLYKKREINDNVYLLNNILKTLPVNKYYHEEINVAVLSGNTAYASIHDYLLYFYPRHLIIDINKQCPTFPNDLPNLLIYADNLTHPCLQKLSNDVNCQKQSFTYTNKNKQHILKKLFCNVSRSL